MTEQEIFERVRELDKIVDPSECNILSGYLSGYIMDYEEQLHELNLIVSNDWLKIRVKAKSANEADKKLEVSPSFRKRERVKLTMAQLKRIRSDLKDRFQILTVIKNRGF